MAENNTNQVNQETLNALVASLQTNKNDTPAKKKLKGVAKFITLGTLIIVLGFGIFGSFNAANFNMNNYVMFLDKFVWIVSPLILSIGGGAVADRLAGSNENKTEEE